MKKIFILLIIVILVGSGFSIYSIFFQEEDYSPPGEGAPTPLGTEQETPEEIGEEVGEEIQIEKISPETVISPTLNQDSSKIIYYNPRTLALEEIDFEGENLQKIADFPFNCEKILWSPLKNKLIGFCEKEGQSRKVFYDLETQETVVLHQNIKNIAWSPGGEKIIYQFYDSETGENKISIADPKTEEWEDVLTTQFLELKLSWPAEEKVFLWQSSSGVLDENNLYQFDLETKNKPQIILSKKFGFKPKFKGNLILFSEVPSLAENLNLKVLNEKEEIKNLKISSLVEKCVFDKRAEEFLYCGIPENLAPDTILPDDYYKNLFQSQDNLWKINIESDQVTQITQSPQYDILNPFLSPAENYLFFTNKGDGVLYSISLSSF